MASRSPLFSASAAALAIGRDAYATALAVLALLLFHGVVDALLLERLPEGLQPILRGATMAMVALLVIAVLGGQMRRHVRALAAQNEALLRSESRLAEAQGVAHIGSWELDLVTSELQWSAEHYRLFGLEPLDGAVPLDPALAFVHPEDRGRLVDELSSAATRRGSYACDVRTMLRNGDVRWIHSRGTFVPAAEGGHDRMVGTAQDVSERVEAERARARLASHVSSLLASTSDGLYGIDRQGLCTFVNGAAAALLGYAAEELLGGHMHSLIHSRRPDGSPLPVEECGIHRAMEAGIATRTRDEVFWRRDGSALPVEYAANPVCEDDEVVGSVVAFRDETERRHAEEVLRESEQRLKLALEIGGIGVWNHDLLTGEVWWGPLTERMLGLVPGTFAGTFADFLARLHDDDRERVAREIAAAHHADADEFQVDYRMSHADGRILSLASRGRFYRAPDGTPVRVLGVTQDVTQREQARRQEELLARSEKLRALGQLAGGVAHDLNQQLGLISGYGTLAQRALREQPLPMLDLERSLEVISRAAVDGGETVNRLLRFARGHMEGEPQPMDLGAVLQEVAELTAPRWRDEAQAAGRPIHLALEVQHEIRALGWPHALREAITNLVLNALDAMPGGGTLRLVARADDDRVIVEVTDSGVGMTAEVQARLFEPFFTTKGERGTGLGLAGVYGIVQRHRGTIEVESSPGKGATFRLALPATSRSSSAATAAPPPARAKLRILAVEDEPQLRTMLARILQALGHDVASVASGEEALRVLGEDQFDVLLSDLGLGDGITGWELIERAHEQRPALSAILVTGWGANIDSGEASARGVRAIIAKPYTVNELQRVLSAA